jgi:hypothetical protein
MKRAVRISTCLGFLPVLPELAAMIHRPIGPHTFSVAEALRESTAVVIRIASSVSQPVWLVLVGCALILLSLFVRHRASRTASQSSH